MKEKVIMIVGIVFFALLVLNIATVFYFYQQYSAKINTLDRQNWLTKVKVENLEKSADGFKSAMENMDSQYKALENTVNLSETNTKTLSSKLQGIKSDMESLHNKYSSTLLDVTDISQKTAMLKADIEQLKKDAARNVDLGKISVEGESQAPSVGAKQAVSAAKASPNFVSSKKK